MARSLLTILLVIASCSLVYSATWHVGPTRTYTKPSQVSTLVSIGDSILIDAGTYIGDTAQWSAANIVLMGSGGMAWLNSGGHVYGDKGIWVINGANTTVINIEFSGAVADTLSNNGAGIRLQAPGLVVSHCSFHDNQNGILTGADATSDIIIEYSEFNNNGTTGPGSGFCHNLYVGHIHSLTFRYNFTHHAIVGHDLKSRASTNYVLYNRISDESTGTASRDIDLPNGGLAVIMGNIIEKGPLAQNSNFLGYGLEGMTNIDSELYVINNTFVNDRSSSVFVQIQNGATRCKMYNNIFAGTGTILTGTAATIDTSHNLYCTIAAASLVNAAAYDYHLLSTSPAINAGTPAGMAGTTSLTPTMQYDHPNSAVTRPVSGTIDIGACEYATSTGVSNAVTATMLVAYPNPVANTLFVEFPVNQGLASVELYDVYNRLVTHKQISGATASLDVTTLPVGIYILRVGNGTELIAKTILIQH